MKVSLVPMRANPQNLRETLESMARWVDALHAQSDLLVFPVNFFEPGVSRTESALSDRHRQYLSELAVRQRVHIAAAFIEYIADEPCQTLIAADRTGQILTQSLAEVRDADASPPPSLPPLVSRIEGVDVLLAAVDRIAPDAHKKHRRVAEAAALFMPFYATAEDSEKGRIASHNPPGVLKEIREEMAHLAREYETHVLAVNAISPDTEESPGSFGGAFVFDPTGKVVAEIDLYDETPLDFDIAEPR